MRKISRNIIIMKGKTLNSLSLQRGYSTKIDTIRVNGKNHLDQLRSEFEFSTTENPFERNENASLRDIMLSHSIFQGIVFLV
jgi:hypothetical protein